MAGQRDHLQLHAEPREAVDDVPRRERAPGAEAVLRLQRSAGNQAVLRALATLAREHKPSPEEREKYAGKNGWTNENLDELGVWAKSAAQFGNVAEGLSYARWSQDIHPAYKDGADAPDSVLEMQVAYQRKHVAATSVQAGTKTFRGLAGTEWTTGSSKRDWSGLYLALTMKHAENYKTEGLEKTNGTGVMSIWECTLKKDLDIIEVSGGFVPDPTINENVKASILKGALDIPAEKTLVPSIGAGKKAYIGVDQGNEKELIVPWELVTEYFTWRRAREFRFKDWNEVADKTL